MVESPSRACGGQNWKIMVNPSPSPRGILGGTNDTRPFENNLAANNTWHLASRMKQTGLCNVLLETSSSMHGSEPRKTSRKIGISLN